ncbi:aryl-sulfate sulfotransferase [bacterium]|nr:aryl-sulfate sulfotransferase [bacterium]
MPQRVVLSILFLCLFGRITALPELDVCPDCDRPSSLQSSAPLHAGPMRVINGVSVPSDFPDIKIITLKSTAPGKVFFGSTFTDIGNYLVIMENDGTPYFYRRYPHHERGSGEFRLQSTGVLTAYLFQKQFFIALDHHYDVVDTFRVGHGYTTDPHELVLLPNGHALMIALETRQMDMSSAVPGGAKNARVTGNHVQEVDAEGHVVLEWKCWERFDIADAVHENLTSTQIDYVHMNSIAEDFDGHLIVSSRHLSEITKIDRHTGDIIWRLGGRHNQFTFINDPLEFSYQHHARPVPGHPNRYTLWDNGNHRQPQISRAVEYEINTQAMSAEKVWEFRYTPDRYSNMMGNAQRLENGNTFINCATWPPLSACEVTQDGEIVFEMEAAGLSSNRVRRFIWEGMLEAPYLIAESHRSGVALIFNKFGDTDIDHYRIYASTDPDSLGGGSTNPGKCLMISAEPMVVISRLMNDTQWIFRVTAVSESGQESDFSNTETVFVHLSVPGENTVLNGDFQNGRSYWTLEDRNRAGSEGLILDGEYLIRITDGGDLEEDIQLKQSPAELIRGRTYTFEFDAHAETARTIGARIVRNTSPQIDYSKIGSTYIKRQIQHYSYSFIMEEQTDFDAMIVFNCGGSGYDIYLDNVSLKESLETVCERIRPDAAALKLYPNRPNPFNAWTAFDFEIPADDEMRLSVINLRGETVRLLHGGPESKGRHRYRLDASNLAGGLYFIRLSTSSGSRVRKIMLIK